MSKFNKRLSRCQQNFKDCLISFDFQQNPVGYCQQNFTETETLVLRQLCYLKQKYNIFKTSQGWIAKKIGVSREYVCRIMSKFESLGILKMWYHHKSTSHYRMSSFFTNEVIASLSHLWRALPLTLLMAFGPSSASSEKSSQNINEDIYILKPSPTYPNLKDSNSARAYTHVEKPLPPLSDQEGRLKKEEKVKESTITGDRRMAYLPSEQRQLLNALTTEYSAEPLFSEAIQSIESLNLTTFGKIKLLAFPDFVIKKADQEGKGFKNPKDPYGFFIANCIRICRETGISPDWKWVNAIKEKLNISDQTPCLIASSPRDSLKRECEGAKQSVSLAEYGARNNRTIQQWSPRLWEEVQKQKEERTKLENKAGRKLTTHEIEWEHTRINEPEKFARWEGKAKEFRQILGLKEDGTFEEGRTPEEAINILSGSQFSNKF